MHILTFYQHISFIQHGCTIITSRSSLVLRVRFIRLQCIKSLLMFIENQITPFSIATPDNELLYAWHVLPLGLYAKHESELLQEPSGCAEDITKTKGFRLLADDPSSLLIINCKHYYYSYLRLRLTNASSRCKLQEILLLVIA
jgi:hypothetical protein